jgi:HPt (histidine-containing phosphotransfer) domain-containing protein
MPEPSILDPNALAGLRELNPGDNGAFLRELIEVFLQDAPGYLEGIRAGVAAQDAPAAVSASHTLKGSASNFGAGRLAAVSLRIEKLAKAGSLEEVRQTLPVLEREFQAVQAELKKVLAELA